MLRIFVLSLRLLDSKCFENTFLKGIRYNTYAVFVKRRENIFTASLASMIPIFKQMRMETIKDESK